MLLLLCRLGGRCSSLTGVLFCGTGGAATEAAHPPHAVVHSGPGLPGWRRVWHILVVQEQQQRQQQQKWRRCSGGKRARVAQGSTRNEWKHIVSYSVATWRGTSNDRAEGSGWTLTCPFSDLSFTQDSLIVSITDSLSPALSSSSAVAEPFSRVVSLFCRAS